MLETSPRTHEYYRENFVFVYVYTHTQLFKKLMCFSANGQFHCVLIFHLPLADDLVYYNWHHNQTEHQELQNTYQSKISIKFKKSIL